MKTETSYKGKELWENIQTFSCIALLVAALIITNYRIPDGQGGYTSIITPDIFETIIIGLIMYVLGYLAAYFYVLYLMSEKNAGVYVTKGHIDQAPGVGEDFKFVIKKFKKTEKLTPKDVEEIKKMLEKAIKDGLIKRLSNKERLKELMGEESGKTKGK